MEEPVNQPSDEIPEPEEIPALEEMPQEEDAKKPKAFSVMSSFQTIIGIAIVMATLLTLWNPRKLLSTPNLNALLQAELSQAQQSTSQVEDTGNHIGILAGHWQDNPGEVCSDGLIEADINQAISTRVSQNLTDLGYKVDIFPEYDMALLNYRSAAFVAIYSGSCNESPLPPSGFKIATSLTAQNPDKVNQLAVCLGEQYQKATKLPFTYEVLNPDNPSYHVFRDINSDSPAVLIEIGSLKTDRNLIVSHSDTVSNGIAAGILCYLDGLNKTSK
jgi:N-acetylmuramoyl-L-alanine amidase